MIHVQVKMFPADGLSTSLVGKAFIGISLGNRQSGLPTALREAIDWTSKHFSHYDFLVGDYLKRHNYEAFSGESESVAIEHAMNDGKRAMNALESVISTDPSCSAALISAETLYSDPEYRSRLILLESHYADNTLFRDLVDKAVKTFIARLRQPALDSKSVRRHCVLYQLEELALFELLAERGYTALVYAGPQLPVMKAMVSKKLSGISRLLEGLLLVEVRSFQTT